MNCLPEAACQGFLLLCLPQLAFQRRLTQSLHAQYCERRAYYAASTLGGGCACACVLLRAWPLCSCLVHLQASAAHEALPCFLPRLALPWLLCRYL